MSRLKEVMADHIRRMTTREESTVALETSVYKHTMWNQLPQRSRARISGYLEATRDHTYANLIHWRLFLDGALRTSKEVDAIAIKENYPPRPIPTCGCEAVFGAHDKDCVRVPFKGAWSRIESHKSKHVWDKDPTKVY